LTNIFLIAIIKIDMKITIYTINDCPYCKTEKEYFAAHNLQFEEKNVEQNREFLAEMLEKSNKFAGVPFTVIVNDQGVETPLKGFTKEEFDKVLGFADVAPQVSTNEPAVATAPAQVAAPSDVPAPVTEPIQPVIPPVAQAPTMPVVETPVVPPEPVAPVVENPVPPMPEAPVVPPAPIAEAPAVPPAAPVDSQLNSVMNNLQAMSQDTGTNPQVPNIPDLPQDNT
jgi:glutaredoxin